MLWGVACLVCAAYFLGSAAWISPERQRRMATARSRTRPWISPIGRGASALLTNYSLRTARLTLVGFGVFFALGSLLFLVH